MSGCSIEGCARQRVARGWCGTHWRRWRTHGDPLTTANAPWGAGTVNHSGYRVVSRRGHPLAAKDGHVFAHRVVLWEAIGPGEHLCHWCSTPVVWRQQTAPGDRLADDLQVDHIDGDRLNNDLQNLVPSCRGCNLLRRNAGNPPVWARESEG